MADRRHFEGRLASGVPGYGFDMGVVYNQGNPLSTGEGTAALWREFCVRFQRQRSGTEDSLQRVVAADPNFGIARATAALMGSSFGHPDFDAPTEIEAARNGAAEHQWERSYVQAASAAAERGPLWGSVDQWFAHHDGCPSDLNGLRCVIVGATSSFDRVRRKEVRGRVERTSMEVGDEPMVRSWSGLDRGVASNDGPGSRLHDTSVPARRTPSPRAR